MTETANKQNLLLPALIIVIAALSFGIGVLWQKVEGLEKGGTQTNVQANPQAGQQPAAQAPSDPLTPVKENTINLPKIEKGEHTRGDQNAKVTLVEYSDLECPYCRKIHPDLAKLISEYKGKIKWVYRHYPLEAIHPSAQKAAEASECAYKMGEDIKFWEYIDKVFELTATQKMEIPLLVSAGEQVGLNKSSFESCVNSGEQAKKVDTQQDGGVKAGVQGTPAGFVFDGKGNVYKIEGALPYDSLKQIIEKAIK